MVRKSSGGKAKSTGAIDALLSKAAARFDKLASRREGKIHLQLLGDGGGDFLISNDGKTTTIASNRGALKEATTAESAQLHIIGDTARIRAILEGRKDGLAAFVGGGIRVRGDLRYLSALAAELGFIKNPF